MTRADDELDEFGKRMFAPLRPTPPIDPQVALDSKVKFLLEGENLRQAFNMQPGREAKRQTNRNLYIFRIFQYKPVMKALVAVLLVFVVILAGSSFTVLASQSSLPGQVLYPVKSWSEDVRLSITSSPDEKLNLTLYFTNRRLEEISNLLADGNTVNDQTANRFQSELEDALQLAAQLDDTQMKHALGEIKNHAEKQGMTMQELISKLPPQADPAVLRLQQRLSEQVQLSNVGEKDPKEFRAQVHGRLQNQHGPKHSPESRQTQSTPDETAGKPMLTQDVNNHGNDMNQPTDMPGHGDQGNGQQQTSPGNGNHGPNPTHTPKP
jgi:hypothetical protein